MEKSTENKIYRAIGLMSGTAMDGIDAAMIETDGYGHIHHIGFESVDHDPEFREKLRSQLNETARDPSIEREFTLRQVPVIQTLLNKTGCTASDIDVIGFHGQSIHHDPDNGITVQLGDGDLLSRETSIQTVYDFRSADMAAGGQGAPFIPVYHRALLQSSNATLPIAIVNIGGVANVTWMSEDHLIGFDTGPGNAMIDDWIKTHTDQKYDDGGQTAAKGRVDQATLDMFLSHEYFEKSYPKSLDRNDFTSLDVSALSLEDGAATLTAMTMSGIAQSINQCPAVPTAIYVTGGGRHNQTIMRTLEDVMRTPVHSVDTLGWNGDALEAEGFAYMAVRTLLNEPISFPDTTGCSSPTIGGVITNPHKADAA